MIREINTLKLLVIIAMMMLDELTEAYFSSTI